MPLQTGKVPPRLLEGLVFNYLGCRREEVLVPAAFGEDSSVLDLGGSHVILSTDPITAAGADAGRLAVIVSCNDVAASGGEPVGVLLTIILPSGATAEDLQQIMTRAHETAKELSVEIIGGHTEVVPHVTQPILSATAVGKAFEDAVHWPILSSSSEEGDALILTKTAGIEGTAILAADFADILRQQGVSDDVLTEGELMGRDISVVCDARIAAGAGARAMHDVTEGGVLGAVYEMIIAAQCGAIIYEDQIPIADCTREICALMDLDPLRLISSGALLIAAAQDSAVTDALNRAGVPACVIGKVTADGGVMLRQGIPGGGETMTPVRPPGRDEIWRAYARFRAQDVPGE
ncbi:MAG: AIR synthase family protein [Bacillota bacterium]